MAEIFFEIFSYSFLAKAFLVGTLVSLSMALLGVSLVLKRYSMIGDGLSHVGFGALAVAAALNAAPMAVAIPCCVAAAVLLLRISENGKIKGDSAIALISAGSLALGVMAISLKKGVNIDLNSYMFGSILAINETQTAMSILLSVAVIFVYIVFYNRIFTVTFDETFARASGLNAGGYNLLLAVLTALVTVLGMRIMGTLLISSLIIFPPIISMRIFKKFKSVVICSAAVSVICFFMGLVMSYVFETPAGASVVVTNMAALAVFAAAEKIKILMKNRYRNS